MIPRRIASIRDVAKRAGVSIATVSNVLNQRCNVSDALRERVSQAVDELGYVTNPIARSMRNSRTNTVGILVLDINCIFFAPLLKGAQRVLSASGYNVNIFDSCYDSELELKYVRNMRNSLVDGLILAGVANRKNLEFYESIAKDAEQRPFPIVSIENDLCDMGIDSVFVDTLTAAYTATSHLIELGCRKIVHIKAPSATTSLEVRLTGYLNALRDAGLERTPQLELPGNFSAISGYNAIGELLRQGVAFDGVFAANDQMAVGAIRALQNAHKRVPEDVKVVGFDNTFVASIVEPALTTIEVPNFEMGAAAARQLLSRLENPDARPVRVQMDYELVIRRSTMASARTNWDMVHW